MASGCGTSVTLLPATQAPVIVLVFLMSSRGLLARTMRSGARCRCCGDGELTLVSDQRRDRRYRRSAVAEDRSHVRCVSSLNLRAVDVHHIIRATVDMGEGSYSIRCLGSRYHDVPSGSLQ